MDDKEIIAKISTVPYWYHQIEIKPNIITPGTHHSKAHLAQLNLPENCTGLRVLDIGARDGFFSFELERRGAEVVAVDYYANDKTGFKVAAELLNSKVTFVQDNIYNITPEKFGKFDIVLFLGLLYHLPDPMRALYIVRDVCKGELYVETQAIDEAFQLPEGSFVPLSSISKDLLNIPIMQFYPGASLNNDPTNFWAPNSKCLELMLQESNFFVLEKAVYGARAVVKARIRFDKEIDYFRRIATGEQNPLY